MYKKFTWREVQRTLRGIIGSLIGLILATVISKEILGAVEGEGVKTVLGRCVAWFYTGSVLVGVVLFIFAAAVALKYGLDKAMVLVVFNEDRMFEKEVEYLNFVDRVW